MRILSNGIAGVAQLTLDAGESATVTRSSMIVDAQESGDEILARITGPVVITLHTHKE